MVVVVSGKGTLQSLKNRVKNPALKRADSGTEAGKEYIVHTVTTNRKSPGQYYHDGAAKKEIFAAPVLMTTQRWIYTSCVSATILKTRGWRVLKMIHLSYFVVLLIFLWL